MIEVYHAREFGKHDASLWPDGFRLVAAVKTNDKEKAFELTNSIDSDWTLNPEAGAFFRGQSRSTSVGDIMIDEKGTMWQVEAFGFRELKRKETHAVHGG